MTSQALALQDAAFLAGMPRKNKWGKKAFSVKTEVKRVKWHNPRTNESGTYSEYGDAMLSDNLYRELTPAQMIEIARGIARAGFSASVYIKEQEEDDGRPAYAHLIASTGWRTEGELDIATVRDGTVYRERETVEINEELKAQAWKRANER